MINLVEKMNIAEAEAASNSISIDRSINTHSDVYDLLKNYFSYRNIDIDEIDIDEIDNIIDVILDFGSSASITKFNVWFDEKI